MAFQLIDDLLDVTATDADLGKPATADLKLGLSTAPVLFASQQVSITQEKKIANIFSF
jgi:geranylgeranyl pyrophosphate synthase